VSLAANSTEIEITPGDILPKKTTQKMQLKRELGLFSAVNLIVGVMIGKVCSRPQLSDIITTLLLMSTN
jgi:amino acid transporter